MNVIPIEKIVQLDKLVEIVALSMPINGVYIFGSYINGNSTPWSDLDIVIISDGFEAYDKKRRIEFIRNIKINNEIRSIDVKPVTLKQWNNGYGFIGTIKQISKKYGDWNDGII